MSAITAVGRLTRLPRRHVLVALCFLASVLAYTDRVNLAVAAVAMKEQFGWSQTQKGFVLSAFFVGYLLFMFAAGVVSTRLGGKLVLGVSVLAWSAFTLLTPAAASVSMAALIVARIGMGIGEAAMFPASFELFGRWVPATERARATAWLLSGIPMGTVIGLTASGWLVGHFGWSSAFYAFGVAGIAWGVVWFRSVKAGPDLDPTVTASELALLSSTATPPARLTPAEYRRLLLSAPVAAISIAHFATTWTLYVLISWLPSYFREVQGLSIANAGLYSAAPWLSMFAATNVVASLSDRLIARGATLTFMRKLVQCLGLVLSAGALLLMPLAQSPGVALVMMCCAMAALGFVNSGFAPAMLDVAPRHGAVISGYSNTFATVPGIVGVATMGWLVDLTGTYTAGFVLTATVSVIGSIAFAVLYDAKRIID